MRSTYLVAVLFLFVSHANSAGKYGSSVYNNSVSIKKAVLPSAFICEEGDKGSHCLEYVSPSPNPNNRDALDTKPNTNPNQNFGNSIQKHKSEIERRCGLYENSKTKITSINKGLGKRITPIKFPSAANTEIQQDITVTSGWRVEYQIESSEKVLGEFSFTRKYCYINAETGEASW
ncbi:MAG: hypothetical protein IPH54_15915 [Rhodoferax sp.]|jgi:hypothetical protein|nr:hypothetical protein [Rhodoferax sp.]